MHSEFGLHIVKISTYILPRTPTVEEIRFKLERDLTAQLKKQNKVKMYQLLRKKYAVSIAPQLGMAATN